MISLMRFVGRQCDIMVKMLDSGIGHLGFTLTDCVTWSKLSKFSIAQSPNLKIRIIIALTS